ncbi:hypothetical protein H0H93_001513 [Arthromyces matolae]|nr:hypothetical protein H0H93_001513 [Arthromyces matolae]
MEVSFNLDCSEDLDETYVSGLGIRPAMLHADMGSQQGDNNTGITVIDITNPEDPAYCFVRGRVLSARGYLGMGPSPDSDSDAKFAPYKAAAAAALEGERLIGLDVLAEAWPKEYQGRLAKQAKDDGEQTTTSDDLPANTPVARLSDLALKPAVEHAIMSGDTTGIVQLLWLPGKAEATIAVLKQHNPFTDAGSDLLAQSLNHLDRNHVDLSGFSLSEKPIISVLKNLRSKVEALDLSDNPLVTVDSVRLILTSLPELQHLVLLNTSVTDEGLSSLFQDHPKLFYNLHSLTHPLLLTTKSFFPNAFAIIVPNASNCQLNAASLPFITPTFLVQALTDYLRTCLSSDLFCGEIVNAMIPLAVLSSTPRNETDAQTWLTRVVPMIASRSGQSAVNGEGWIFGVNSETAYGFFRVEASDATTVTEESAGDTPSTSSETTTGGEQQQEQQQQPRLLRPRRVPDWFGKIIAEKRNHAHINKVLNLSEFLAHLTSEGRTPAPESAVKTLFAILDQLQARDWFNFPLMDLEQANAFLDEYYYAGMVHQDLYQCVDEN